MRQVSAQRYSYCYFFGLFLAICLFALPTRGQERQFGPTPSAPGAVAFFANLKDGDTIPEKFVIRFGIEKMDVAPAGSAVPNSGHHHLLIDTELPPFNRPIPNDFKHLHFGGGQTEATITLSPGDHTLQLLFADKDHVPHNPPVVSDRIKVTVVENMPATKSAKAPAPDMTPMPMTHDMADKPDEANSPSAYKRKPSPPNAKVYLESPVNGAVVAPTVKVRFGLLGMGVAPAGFSKANTGHHHLLIDVPLPPLDAPIPNDFNHIHFGLGQTEADVKLPPGKHTLQLLLADDAHVPHDPPVYSPVVHVLVTTTGKRPKVHIRHQKHFHQR